jgi:AraC family transcriptional activator of pobA
MAYLRNIENHDLLIGGKPVNFAVKTMEEIAAETDRSEVPHRHNYYTVIWPTDASGEHTIDFSSYPIAPNVLFFIPPEKVHHLRTADHPKGFVILFTRDFLLTSGIDERFITDLDLFQEHGQSTHINLGENTAALQELVLKMLALFNSNDTFATPKIGAYLKLFLIDCHQIALAQVGSVQLQHPNSELIIKFKALVDLHFTELHKVVDYADKLFITPNYLNEVIRKHLGITAKEYIQERIVLEAKRMVYFTNLSSKEIGFRLGFEDPSHFTKFFKKQTNQLLHTFKKEA